MLHLREILPGSAADRAFPVAGQFLEGSFRSDIINRIALERVINIAADVATVEFEFFHGSVVH